MSRYSPPSFAPTGGTITGDVTFSNGADVIGLRDKGDQVFNVKAYGAVGDGIADDQAAINAAITACNAAGGGTVYVPPGTYVVGPSGLGGAIWVRAKVRLVGAGITATTLLLANATNLGVVAFEYDADDMAVSHMTLNGNRANQTLDVHGLRFQGNGRAYAGHLHVTEARRYGIGIGYTLDTQIPVHDALIEFIEISNVGYGAVGDAFDGKRSEHVTIRDIYAHDCVANGLDIRGNHTRISNVYVADVGGVGFSQRQSAYDPPNTGTLQTGTVATTSGSPTVTGTGTAFTTALKKGDLIRIADTAEKLIVKSIATDTSLTASTNAVTTEASSTYYREYIRESRHLYAENITVERCGSHGIWADAVEGDAAWLTDAWFGRNFIVNAIARNCGGRGFYLEGQRIYTTLTNCLAEGNASHGFQVNASNLADYHAKLMGCTAKDNGIDGFNDPGTNGTGTLYVGCEAVGNAGEGFSLASSRNSLVGCCADLNTSYGFDLVGNDTSLQGGSAIATTSNAIRSSGNRNLIQGVSVDTTTGIGINVTAGDSTRITNNNLDGVGGAKIANSGTNTVARDNIGAVDIGTDNDPKVLIVRDHFISGTIGAGTTGDLGWTPGSGVTSAVVAEAGRAGIIRRDTSATINTIAYLILQNTTVGNLLPAEFFDATFIFRLNQTDADIRHLVGLALAGSTIAPANGIYIEKLTTDTQWFGVTRAASVQTRTAALATCDTNWHTLRIRRIDASTVGFTMDANAEVTATANIPTSPLVPAFNLQTLAAVAKTHEIDYFSLRVTGLAG